MLRNVPVLVLVLLALAPAAAARPGSPPPHHGLWLCLHSHEAQSWRDRDSGGNGHFGGLQMTPAWGGYFRGTADRYTQLEQEWFAERGYRSSGFASWWLRQQWGQTIGWCWRHA